MVKASNDNGSAKVTVVVEIRPKDVLIQETVKTSEYEDLSSEDLTETDDMVKKQISGDKIDSKVVEESQQGLVKLQQSDQLMKTRHPDDKLEKPVAKDLQTVAPKNIAQQLGLSENDDAESSSFEESDEEVELTEVLQEKIVVPKIRERATSEESDKDQVEKRTSVDKITIKTKTLKKETLIEQTDSSSEEFDEVLEIKDVTQVISAVAAESFLPPTAGETPSTSSIPLNASTVTPSAFIPVDEMKDTRTTDENNKQAAIQNITLESDKVAVQNEELSGITKVKKTKNKPVILIKPEPIVVKEGEPIVLTCRATG